MTFRNGTDQRSCSSMPIYECSLLSSGKDLSLFFHSRWNYFLFLSAPLSSVQSQYPKAKFEIHKFIPMEKSEISDCSLGRSRSRADKWPHSLVCCCHIQIEE